MSEEPQHEPDSNLASSYDLLTRDLIDHWVTARRIEDVTLDFSTAPKCFEARDERENLAKAISAFANATGGLIVWGVRATKDEDGLDAAQQVDPIRDQVRFLSNLTTYSGSAVSPPVPGLRSRMIDESVAVTLVPESDGGPYMANLGVGRYYTRSGSSSLPMEHFQVVDVFNRRRRPDLRLRGIVGPNDQAFDVRLVNVGRASAKSPYVEVLPLGPWVMENYGLNLPVILQGGGDDGDVRRLGGSTSTVIHPETVLQVCKFRWQGAVAKLPPSIEIRCSIAAEEMPLVAGTLILPRRPGAVVTSERE